MPAPSAPNRRSGARRRTPTGARSSRSTASTIVRLVLPASVTSRPVRPVLRRASNRGGDLGDGRADDHDVGPGRRLGRGRSCRLSIGPDPRRPRRGSPRCGRPRRPARPGPRARSARPIEPPIRPTPTIATVPSRSKFHIPQRLAEPVRPSLRRVTTAPGIVSDRIGLYQPSEAVTSPTSTPGVPRRHRGIRRAVEERPERVGHRGGRLPAVARLLLQRLARAPARAPRARRAGAPGAGPAGSRGSCCRHRRCTGRSRRTGSVSVSR